MITYRQFITEKAEACPIISKADVNKIEQFFDRVFKEFKLEFNFSKHFVERLSDSRNDPCISAREFAEFLKKVYLKKKEGGLSLAKYKDSEIVLKDMQTDLNMPVAVEYDRKNDEINVIGKTIMRKKNFKTPSPVVKVN